MSESCPKCGMAQTGKIDEGYRHFDCFSFAHESGSCFQQSKQCTALAAATKRAEDLQATITRIAEAQRQHCTTECIDGVWWAKGNGIVAGPQVTEQEVLLEVAEMGIAAAEQENARMREGIQEMLRYYPVVSGDWVSSNLAALLAQPEGGE